MKLKLLKVEGKEVKLWLFVDNIILYVKKNPLKATNKRSEAAGHIPVNTQHIVFIYTLVPSRPVQDTLYLSVP